MADGYEVFDTGHNRWRPVRQHLNPAQSERVLAAVLRCRPTSLDEARTLLLHACGHRVQAIDELYDVELQPVLEKLGRMERERAAARRLASRDHT